MNGLREIHTGRLRFMWARHWSANSFDSRFWVLFGPAHWLIPEVLCVVDDFGDLIAVRAD